VINVDKNTAKAIDELKAKKELSSDVELRQNKYLNNRIEQNHRFIKWLVKRGLRFKYFNSARRTIKGYEIMHVEKGKFQEKRSRHERLKFIEQIFGVTA